MKLPDYQKNQTQLVKNAVEHICYLKDLFKGYDIMENLSEALITITLIIVSLILVLNNIDVPALIVFALAIFQYIISHCE